MKYDTQEWRAARDRLLMEVVGDAEACAFLRIVGAIAETWDDLVDGDKLMLPERVHRAFWNAIVELPENRFFAAFRGQLLPVMMAGMNAWMDSCDLERGNRDDRAIAFGLRDFYLELVSMTILIVRGYEAMRADSARVRSFLMLSHERIDDFLEGRP